jgi:hypothetical protein
VVRSATEHALVQLFVGTTGEDLELGAALVLVLLAALQLVGPLGSR